MRSYQQNRNLAVLLLAADLREGCPLAGPEPRNPGFRTSARQRSDSHRRHAQDRSGKNTPGRRPSDHFGARSRRRYSRAARPVCLAARSSRSRFRWSWRRLGTTATDITSLGNGRYSWTDKHGSEKCARFTALDRQDLRVWYAEGKVRVTPLMPLVPVQAVLVMRHAGHEEPKGRSF